MVTWRHTSPLYYESFMKNITGQVRSGQISANTMSLQFTKTIHTLGCPKCKEGLYVSIIHSKYFPILIG